TLGVSTSVSNALGMGIAATLVLIGSNFLVSLLKDYIDDSIRIPSFIVIIASFVTITQMIMNAYLPDLYDALGVYLPLIVVNCIILGRAEAFASKNKILASVMDAIGMGIGFTMSLTLIALIREVIGNGTISLFAFRVSLPGLKGNPVRVLAAPAGALFVMGYLKAAFNKIQDISESRRESQEKNK
ncbi:MAG TPA: electron transport complex subunit RsxE, partial [Spirochaetaceae bacterium]|nr:electron transport complex subunit RsxE [Spirochaetaceae bacterium]